MKLDVFEALSDGFERSVEKNGLMLAGLYLVFSLISTASVHTLYSNGLLESLYGPAMSGSTTGWALALPLPNAAAGVLAAVSMVASYLLAIATIRTMVSGETEVIPNEYYTQNLLMPTLNLIVGGIAYAVILAAAILIPMAPGGIIAGLGVSQLVGGILALLGGLVGSVLAVYLLVALYFWNFFVVVEDDNFIEALRNSWDLTEGNRLRLFVLGLIVMIATGAVSGILGIPGVLGMKTFGPVLSQAGSAFMSVFTVATMAQAYNRLK